MLLTDIYEIAILKLQGFEAENVVTDHGRIKFEFTDKKVSGCLKDFYEGKITVDANKYMHAVQDIRATIFNLKKSGT